MTTNVKPDAKTKVATNISVNTEEKGGAVAASFKKHYKNPVGESYLRKSLQSINAHMLIFSPDGFVGE